MPRDVEARVIQNTRLSPDYNVITLAAPEIAATTRPGQFVMVRSNHGSDPLLRRPFSVFEIVRSGDRIEGLSLLSKRIGVTTRLLFDAVEGDVISCLGPLGQPFEPVSPPSEAWMVAGGVGLAPFATLSGALLERGTTTTLFYGARTGAELFYLDWFASRGVHLVLSTEDGSKGERGRVTVPLEQALRRNQRRDHDLRLRAGKDARGSVTRGRQAQATGTSLGRASHGVRDGGLLQLRHPGPRSGRPSSLRSFLPRRSRVHGIGSGLGP